MPGIRFLLKVSRPRFWIYVFGPFIVGLAGAATDRADLLRPDIALFTIYFLLPANLLIYGVNDLFDFETDRRNPKKSEYELLVRPESHRYLIAAILLTNFPLLIAALIFAPAVIASLAGFLFFSIFYSARPIRAKAKPMIDSLFNILYLFPGIIGYQLIAGTLPPLPVIVAGALWTTAMHAYSAVPDIDADRESGLLTIATFLGGRGTLILCLLLYLASAVLTFNYLGAISFVLAAVYALMIAASFAAINADRVFSVYRLFPIVNTACGFLLFWYAVYLNFR
jgi:lycopene elongase/hydratase (dihydrobisanhydrobacterioruberin-forming)